MLVVIVIFAVVSVFIINLTVTSISKYRVIAAETTLRDEADIIMAQIYSSIYKLKESSICNNSTLTTTNVDTVITYTPNSKSSVENCSTSSNTIGLTSAKQFTLVNGQKYTVFNNEIEVESFYLKKTSPGNYEINLSLKLVGKNITRKFNNQVRTIYDL